MKKTTKARLELKRVTIGQLGKANGGWHVISYDDGCSFSCNTCDEANAACIVLDETDLCELYNSSLCYITNGCSF